MAANVLGRIDELFDGTPGGSEEGELNMTLRRRRDDAPERPPNPVEGLNVFIEDEISRSLNASGMTWRKLGACFKWQKLKTHLASLGVGSTDVLHLRTLELLKSNALTDVEYDSKIKAVVRVNHPNLPLPYRDRDRE